jgi:maltooligosyltrehalose trehalohydrolase
MPDRPRVWAPRARRVELQLADQRLSMRPAGGGWFEAPAPLAPGTDYRFRLDGGEPLPDPRSPWQPQGPDGPSRTVDHSAFSWSDRGWNGLRLADAIVYELHVGTFSPQGTFAGVIPHIDHLLQLGVSAVELMPVAEFSGRRNWGYDGVDLYAPHHAYGGPEGLKSLVDALHARGLAVILDVVYNHLGPIGNYLDRFGPYLTDRYRTPWGAALNLDGPESDEVRAFLIDNALMWLRDYHLDGLRLDAVHAIFDTSAIHFLEELRTRVVALEREDGRRRVVIAESDLNDPRLVREASIGGFELDAQWSDDFHHALHALLTGERGGYYQDFGRFEDLARALRQGYVFDGRYSSFRRRRHGRSPAGVAASRFLGYLQNHDQVGNRARGDRISSLVSVERLEIGAALVLTAPFIPLLFMGEEWGASTPFPFFIDHQDPAIARAASQGRLAEFAALGWDPAQIPDPQAPATFAAARLRWEERGRSPQAEILAWYRALIDLRRRNPALRDGRFDRVEVGYDQEAGWLTLRRGPVLLACNLGDRALRLPAPDGPLALSCGGARVEDGRVLLPPDSLALFA